MQHECVQALVHSCEHGAAEPLVSKTESLEAATRILPHHGAAEPRQWQVSTRPPTFALFANRNDVPEPYLRFLRTTIQEEFHFENVPIRLFVRSPDNPFSR